MCVALSPSSAKPAGIPLLPSGILRKTVSPSSASPSAMMLTTRFVSPVLEIPRVAGTVKSVSFSAEVSSLTTSTTRSKELGGAAESVTGISCVVLLAPSAAFDSDDAKPTIPFGSLPVASLSTMVNSCVPRVVLIEKPDKLVSSVIMKDSAVSIALSSSVAILNSTKLAPAGIITCPVSPSISLLLSTTVQVSGTAEARSPEASTLRLIESPSWTLVGLFGVNDTTLGAGSSTVSLSSVVARLQPIAESKP